MDGGGQCGPPRVFGAVRAKMQREMLEPTRPDGSRLKLPVNLRKPLPNRGKEASAILVTLSVVDPEQILEGRAPLGKAIMVCRRMLR